MHAGQMSRPVSHTGEQGRAERGDTLAFVILWPTMIVAILLLLVHTFIVVNAQAEAEVAASAALRAAWHSAAGSDFLTNPDTGSLSDPHPNVLKMANDAKDAAARVAGTSGEGWRWWTPGAVEVRSDWCQQSTRPGRGEAGWVEISVQGAVHSPLAALWPNRLDRVYAIAAGPALLNNSLEPQINGFTVPESSSLAVCP